ncbi:neural cell adhesion molecule 1-like [Oscarella lobularis]|uniref:neural cell adhesion molecule 1-like n=1 Tax=Oscarella lobularis TaxID=121494 RepID=UPI0033139591
MSHASKTALSLVAIFAAIVPGFLLAENPTLPTTTTTSGGSTANPDERIVFIPQVEFVMKTTGIRGENATLECPFFTMNEIVRVTWTRRRLPLEQANERAIVASDGKAHIQNLTRNDRGSYQCTVYVRGGVPIRSKVKLLIQERPTLLVRPAAVKLANAGDSIALHCPNHGRPTPRVVWFKDGVRFNANNERIIQYPNGKLFLFRVGSTDAGNYTCRVRNHHGEVVATTEVIMLESPSIAFLTEPKVAAKGRVTLTCRAMSEGQLGIHWEFASKKLSHKITERVETEPNGLKVVTSSLDLRITGTKRRWDFTCKAKNEHGSVKQSTFIGPY